MVPSPAQTASDDVHIQSSLLCVSIYLSIYLFL
jgi:hypothetical protein